MPRRGENIYKRKDGRWEGRYIKLYDANHKAKYGYVYANTYREVKNKLIHEKSKPKNNNVNSIQTVDYYAKMWLNEVQLQTKHSTYVKYANIINNHIIPEIGLYKISDLNTEQIRTIIDKKLRKGKLNGDGGLSAKTVRDILSVMKLIIRYTENLGIESHCKLDMVKIKSSNKKVPTFNQHEQIQLINFLLSDIDYTKLGILICIFTGMRIGEICALKFKDISMKEKVVHITKTMQRLQNFSNDKKEKTSVMITSPKSECSQRDIPIPDFIVQLILNMNFLSEDYILTGRSDCFVEPRTLQNRFKTYLIDCGLKEITFHQLRHQFATCCVELGFELKSLSEILGHSSVNITLNRYVHSSLELKRQNICKLEEVLIH